MSEQLLPVNMTVAWDRASGLYANTSLLTHVKLFFLMCRSFSGFRSTLFRLIWETCLGYKIVGAGMKKVLIPADSIYGRGQSSTMESWLRGHVHDKATLSRDLSNQSF